MTMKLTTLLAQGYLGEAALESINRVMCKIISAQLLKGPESPTKSRFWFFCDEMKYAGRLIRFLIF